MVDMVPLQGTAVIPGLARTVGDFWAWAYSNLVANTTRSTYGEYLVAAALGIDNAPRKEWTSYDLTYRERTIEVKTSGHLQAWHQNQPSIIEFDIAPRKYTWRPEDNVVTELRNPTRVASLYVFCIHTVQNVCDEELATHDPALLVGVQNWRFHAVPTFMIDRSFGNQKRVRYSSSRASVEPQGCRSCEYEKLKTFVDRYIDEIGAHLALA